MGRSEFDGRSSDPEYREWQIRLAMAMLGAIAFEIMFGEGTTLPSNQIRDSVRYQGGQWFKIVLTKRIIDSGAYRDVMDQPMPPKAVLKDWKQLLQMESAGMHHFVFASASRGDEGEIRFNDISTQAFLAAYWAYNYGTPDNAFESLWKCVPDEFMESNWVYAEFWRLVAEMPEGALYASSEVSPRRRWCELLSPIFDPRRENSMRDSKGNLIRSNELICRAWISMREIRNSSTTSWSFFSQIRCGQFKEMLRGDLGIESQRTARELLFTNEGNSKFIGMCEGEHENDNGGFTMGCKGKSSYQEESREHRVRLTHYRFHRYAVSNLEYELYDDRHRPRREFEAEVPCVDQHPVVNVSWWDSLAFAIWLGDLKIEGRVYELLIPTEAQWEYAFFAGFDKPISIIDTVEDSIAGEYGNFFARSPWPMREFSQDKTDIYLERVTQVFGFSEDCRILSQNRWGVSQLHDKVWEWVYDWYDAEHHSEPGECQEFVDPIGPNSGWRRVLRGGSWNRFGRNYPSLPRERFAPSRCFRHSGFRLSAAPIDPG